MSDSKRELELHIRSMRRYAIALTHSNADADDLVQEALRRALAYVGNAGEIRDWRAYLFKILHNVRNDQFASAARAHPHVSLDGVGSDELTYPPMQELRLQCQDVARAVELLSEDQRRVLLLVGLQGFAYREVAQMLDIPIGTVMSRLNRARESLRQSVGRDVPDRRQRVN